MRMFLCVPRTLQVVGVAAGTPSSRRGSEAQIGPVFSLSQEAVAISPSLFTLPEALGSPRRGHQVSHQSCLCVR